MMHIIHMMFQEIRIFTDAIQSHLLVIIDLQSLSLSSKEVWSRIKICFAVLFWIHNFLIH